VRVAVLVAVAPSILVNTARNCQPFANAVGFPLKVVEVNPGTTIHVLPRSTEVSHCTVGVGVLRAAAAKLSVHQRAPTARSAATGRWPGDRRLPRCPTGSPACLAAVPDHRQSGFTVRHHADNPGSKGSPTQLNTSLRLNHHHPMPKNTATYGTCTSTPRNISVDGAPWKNKSCHALR
jgi:hypothetical protein